MENDIQILNSSDLKAQAQPMASEFSVGLDESKLHEVIPKRTLCFDEWTSLILEMEKKYPDDIEKICLVYDSFLSEFPLCHGYWKKFAAHKSRLCTVDSVVDVFEKAVQSATYSVSIWVDYCSFSITAFEDPSDIRRLFRRAISFVGKDYLSYSLWDKYIEFELSQQQWDSLALIYIQTLRFPTKKLHYYYNSFKKLTTSLKVNIQSETGSNPVMTMESEPLPDGEIPICYTDTEISSVIKDLLGSSIDTIRYDALQKYIHTGEKFYDEAHQLEGKIIHYEREIGRAYFHVKQLDAIQLKNWHCYLDFVEMHGDFDWAVKLYERCLIPCANYPDFWMRYAEFMETKGGREIAKFALERATETFLKRVPAIHLFNARFKEQMGDFSGARAAFLQLDGDLDSNFAENIILKANMEKRMGNLTAASNVYKEALEIALAKKNLHVLPSLYIHFSHLKYVITESVDAAMEVLIDGTRNLPHCKLLFEELIRFVMLHGGPKRISLVDSVIAEAISLKPDVSGGWSEQEKEDISSLYLEAVDLCGTIHDIKKALNRHIKLFPRSIQEISYMDPASGIEALRIAEGGNQATVPTVTNQPIKDGGPGQSTQLLLEENKQPLSENKDLQHDQTINGNEVSCLLGDHNTNLKESTADRIHSAETEISAEERVQQSSLKVFEHSGEDGSEYKLVQVPLDNSKYDEYDHSLERSLKNLSMENLSLSPKDIDKNDSLPKTYLEEEAPPETNMSNESMCNINEREFMQNPLGFRSPCSIHIPSEEPSPSSAIHDKPILSQTPSQSNMPATRNGKWHHKHSSGNTHRDSQRRFHRHPQRRPYQKGQDSPQQYKVTELGPQMSGSQDYNSESIALPKPPVEESSQEHIQIRAANSHDNSTIPPALPAQLQNFPTTSQSHPSSQGFTPENSQYITPNDAQYGHMQSGPTPQTYDQMWQYYYFQQQQYLLQQQQFQSQFLQQQYHQQQLQVQQHYSQSLQQYPYQELQLQQQLHSQQQQQQVLQATSFQQQHQHLLGLQPQLSQTDQLSLQQHDQQSDELEEEEQKQQPKVQISSMSIQMQTKSRDQMDSRQNSGSNNQSGAEPEKPNEATVNIEATP